MDVITKARTQSRKEQWVRLIQERQNSELTIKKWCIQNDISEHAYYYWLRQIKEAACNEHLPVAKDDSSVPIVFVPLKVEKKASSVQVPIIIHMPNQTLRLKIAVLFRFWKLCYLH